MQENPLHSKSNNGPSIAPLLPTYEETDRLALNGGYKTPRNNNNNNNNNNNSAHMYEEAGEGSSGSKTGRHQKNPMYEGVGEGEGHGSRQLPNHMYEDANGNRGRVTANNMYGGVPGTSASSSSSSSTAAAPHAQYYASNVVGGGGGDGAVPLYSDTNLDAIASENAYGEHSYVHSSMKTPKSEIGLYEPLEDNGDEGDIVLNKNNNNTTTTTKLKDGYMLVDTSSETDGGRLATNGGYASPTDSNGGSSSGYAVPRIFGSNYDSHGPASGGDDSNYVVPLSSLAYDSNININNNSNNNYVVPVASAPGNSDYADARSVAKANNNNNNNYVAPIVSLPGGSDYSDMRSVMKQNNNNGNNVDYVVPVNSVVYEEGGAGGAGFDGGGDYASPRRV